MMRQRRLSVRLFWLVVAALQFAGPPAAAWADARLEAQSAPGAPQHIEEHSTSRCPRGHPADCVLCHFLTRPLVTPARPPAVIPSVAVETPDPQSTGPRPMGAPSLLPQSRAPPALA